MALATFSNYRTGISISLSGTNGTDWMVDPCYWDPLVDDRQVIFLKSDTQITLSHNARNRYYTGRNNPVTIGANGLDATPDSGDEGRIRYKVDGDMSWGPLWSDFSVTKPAFPQYTTPLTFAALAYPSGSSGGGAVLGAVGHNGGAITSKTARFHFGAHDAAGNECHSITVADDSRLVAGVFADAEYYADDGRVFMFVVNPVTPCLQVRSAGGKFYTTPWKTAFMPKVHAQTTYIEGAVELELKALTGEDVSYRINGSAWTTLTNPILTESDFASGSNTLDYYYGGNTAHIATRTVVKNPTHPSASETHGYLLVCSADNWTAMQSRVTREPYKSALTRAFGSQAQRVEWDANRRQGLRYVPKTAQSNALAAKFYGNDAVPASAGTARTYAAYAKEMLLENTRTIDCVGFERTHSGFDPVPTREHIYRGYWDVAASLDMAYAYDILIDQYKSTQHADGITPIEDYYIRDCIASNIVECMGFSNYIPGTNYAVDTGGMWDVSRKVGALVQMFALPTYSTHYYGTCGLDGNTATYTYTPWATEPLTWKKSYLDDDAPMTGFPNQSNRFGLDVYNCSSDGRWVDAKSYFPNLCGPVFLQALVACKYFYPAKAFPYTELVYRNAAAGNLYAMKYGSQDTVLGPVRAIFLGLLNSTFPEIADAAIDFVRNEPSSSAWSDDKLIVGAEIRSIIGYDDTYVAGAGTPTSGPTFTTQPASATRTAGQSVTFSVVVTGNPTPTRQWRKDGVNISGQTGTSYTIASTVVGDAGLYTCAATNSVGTVISAEATLVVNAVEPEPETVTRRVNYNTPAAVLLGL